MAEIPRPNQGLRLPETERGTAWRTYTRTDSSLQSLASIATPTTDSAHSWPSKRLPISNTSAVPTVASEGGSGYQTYMRESQIRGETLVGKGVGAL